MKARERTLLITLGVAILLLLFMQTPLMTPVRNSFWITWTHTVGRMLGVEDVNPESSTNDQLERLQNENLRLKAELADYRQLRQELGTPSIDDYRFVPAAIIARSFDGISQSFTIARGTHEGVAIGDPVVARENVLVGFIGEARDTTATVHTLLHPDVVLKAETVPDDSDVEPARGLLESVFQSSLQLTTIPRDAVIHENRSIVTAADENGTPYGLIIGSVEKIESGEHSAYQEAKILPPLRYDALRSVTVLARP